MVRGLQSRSVLITFFGKKTPGKLEFLSMVATWIENSTRKSADQVVKGQLISDHKFVVVTCHRGNGTIWDLDHFLAILVLLFLYFCNFIMLNGNHRKYGKFWNRKRSWKGRILFLECKNLFLGAGSLALKSLPSETAPLATQFFKRSYWISHNPKL